MSTTRWSATLLEKHRLPDADKDAMTAFATVWSSTKFHARDLFGHVARIDGVTNPSALGEVTVTLMDTASMPMDALREGATTELEAV
jgi:hypothetical protein